MSRPDVSFHVSRPSRFGFGARVPRVWPSRPGGVGVVCGAAAGRRTGRLKQVYSALCCVTCCGGASITVSSSRTERFKKYERLSTDTRVLRSTVSKHTNLAHSPSLALRSTGQIIHVHVVIIRRDTHPSTRLRHDSTRGAYIQHTYHASLATLFGLAFLLLADFFSTAAASVSRVWTLCGRVYVACGLCGGWWRCAWVTKRHGPIRLYTTGFTRAFVRAL